MLFSITVATNAEGLSLTLDPPLVIHPPHLADNLKEGSRVLYNIYREGDLETAIGAHEVLVVGKTSIEGVECWEIVFTYSAPTGAVSIRLFTPTAKPSLYLNEAAKVVIETDLTKIPLKKFNLKEAGETLKQEGEATVEINGKSFETAVYSATYDEKAPSTFWFAEGVGPYGMVKAKIIRADEKRIYLLESYQ